MEEIQLANTILSEVETVEETVEFIMSVWHLSYALPIAAGIGWAAKHLHIKRKGK